jgi:hypothetical protein
LGIVCGKIRGIRWLEFIGKGVIKEQGSAATDSLSEDVTDLTEVRRKFSKGFAF